MKIRQLIFGIFCLSAFQSCIDDSARALINFNEFIPTEDTTYIDLDTLAKVEAQPKNVLIEDFTGIKCSNCPKAAKTIKTIKENNPDRIVSMGIHAGIDNFTYPKTGHSKYDFRTNDGENIALLLGSVINMPIGTVDLVKFEGTEAILNPFNLWDGQTDKRISLETSPLNINIDILNVDSDTLTFLVRVIYHTMINDEINFLNVCITEDGLVDYQYDIELGDIEDYEHEHVFRKSVTNYSGDSLKVEGLTNPYVEGRVFQRRFVVPIQKDVEGAEFKLGWNYNNLNVVAFVHRKRAEDFEVIHVVEKHVSE